MGSQVPVSEVLHILGRGCEGGEGVLTENLLERKHASPALLTKHGARESVITVLKCRMAGMAVLIVSLTESGVRRDCGLPPLVWQKVDPCCHCVCVNPGCAGHRGRGQGHKPRRGKVPIPTSQGGCGGVASQPHLLPPCSPGTCASMVPALPQHRASFPRGLKTTLYGSRASPLGDTP